MNTQAHTDELNARQREADSWYLRLEDPELQDKEWRSFIKWQSIPENQEAFDATAAQRELMFRVRQRSVSTRPSEPLALSPKLVAIAAVICLHLGVIATVVWHELQPNPLVFVTGAKAAGWQLEDGSFLRAEPNTRVEVEFDKKRRSTRLRYGTAFFQVAKEVDRPFLVRMKLADIEVRGTAFGVSLGAQDAKVTVMRGTVAVSPNSAGDTSAAVDLTPFYLHQNEQAHVSRTSIKRLRSTDVAQALTWATTIQFDNRPALEAVTEFSERSGIKITFDASSPALASPVSGVFQFDAPVEFAQQVANKSGSTVLVYRPGMPTIRVKPPQSTALTRTVFPH